MTPGVLARRSALVLTVSADRCGVESLLRAGCLACPRAGCGGVLRCHGLARRRLVFMGVESREVGRVWVQPLRARCGSCRVTQVLLDERCLSRRMDGLRVIEVALARRAGGVSLRGIAGLVGRALSTVRGWVASAVVAARWAPVVFGMLVDRLGIDPGASWGVSLAGVGALVSAGARLAVCLGARPGDWLGIAGRACHARVLQSSLWKGGFPHQFALMDPRVIQAVLSSGP